MITGMNVGSQGMQLNRMLDALGLPDFVGDAIGARVDSNQGDMAGYLRNITDLNSGLDTAQMDQLFGAGLPGPHHIENPASQFKHSRKVWGHTFAGPNGQMSIERHRLGPEGKRGRRIGRRMERAMLRSPAFKAQMEQMLGGRVVMDGRTDGMVTVQRYQPAVKGMPFNNQIAQNPQLSGLYGALAGLENNITKMAGSLTDTTVTGGSSDNKIFSDPDTRQLAEGMGMKPPLAFEDMLFLMMMKYGRKKESEIMGKMNELSGKGELSTAQNATSQQPAGLFGGLIGGPSQAAFQQQASQILTNPGTSNTLKQMQMEKLAADFQKSGGQVGESGAFGDPQKTSDTLKQMQLQKMMEDLKKMYEMLSNVMKSMHTMQMAAVRNLR